MSPTAQLRDMPPRHRTADPAPQVLVPLTRVAGCRDAVCREVQVLAAAPPLQRYFTSPGQLTANGLLGGAMRELLQAQAGSTAAAAGAVQRSGGGRFTTRMC